MMKIITLVIALVILVPFVLAEEFEGSIEAIILDHFKSNVIDHNIVYFLQTDTIKYELVTKKEIPLDFIRKNVIIEGNLLQGNRIMVNEVTPSGMLEIVPQLTTGPQKTIVLLLKFANNTYEPFQPLLYQNLVFGSINSIKDFWESNSYNLMVVENNGTYGWLTLPNTLVGYNYPSVNLYPITVDGLAVLNNFTGIQVQNLDRLIIFFNDNFSPGWPIAAATLGYMQVSTPYGSRIISVNWNSLITSNSYNLTGYIAGPTHEYGHSLGFWHSSCFYPPYSSPWDVMSGFCNVNISGVAHTTIHNKIDADWLNESDIVTVSEPSSIQTIVYPTTKTSGVRAVKILTPDPSIFYTIEVRKQEGNYDSCLPASGVIIHKINASACPVDIIDSTPGDYNFDNAQWSIGQIYNDPTFNFTINIVSNQPNDGILISINNSQVGSQCLQPTSNMLIIQDTRFCPGTYNVQHIMIFSNNVILDCNGAKLIGNGAGVGIYARDRTNIAIKNCYLEGYLFGIYLDNVALSYIRNNVFDSGNFGGYAVREINTQFESRNTVTQNTFFNLYSNGPYDGGVNNTFFLNNFITAYVGSIGFFNQFGNSGPGNFWVNPFYNCVDNNLDGFCDTPYQANYLSLDYFPLVHPNFMNMVGDSTVGNSFNLTINNPLDPNKQYLILAAFSSNPPIQLPDGRYLYLAPDPLFFFTVFNPNNPYLQNTYGTLDSNGRATATINIPNDSSLSGLDLYFAFVILDPTAPSGIARISHTIKTTII